MARNVALLLGVAAAANAAVVLHSTTRLETCEYCSQLCPISCFAGACPANVANMPSVRKYKATGNSCYSCDPAMSVGISTMTDLFKCMEVKLGAKVEKDTSKLANGGDANAFKGASGSPYLKQAKAEDGPQGPSAEGDSNVAAQKAAEHAKIAYEAATRAAELSLKAATSAGASRGGAEKSMLRVKSDVDPEKAAQIRAADALRAAEATHTSWKVALVHYNSELWKLREQQLLTQSAERDMDAAAAFSTQARKSFAMEKQSEYNAMSSESSASGTAATAGRKITTEEAAEEMAGAAAAAHRRLVFSARAASEGLRKLSDMAISAPKQIPVPTKKAKFSKKSVLEVDTTESKEKAPTTPVPTFAFEPPASSALQQARSIKTRIGGELDLDTPEVAMQAQKIENEMESNLEQRLAANPMAIEDPNLFMPPTMPAMPQLPGMQEPADVDFRFSDMKMTAFLQKD